MIDAVAVFAAVVSVLQSLIQLVGRRRGGRPAAAGRGDRSGWRLGGERTRAVPATYAAPVPTHCGENDPINLM